MIIMGSAALNVIFSLQGLFLLANGVYMLSLPDHATSNAVLHGAPEHVLIVLRWTPHQPSFVTKFTDLRSLSSLSLGASYLVAGLQGNRTIMKTSLLGRVLATAVFTHAGEPLASVARFELAAGLLTAITMYVSWHANCCTLLVWAAQHLNLSFKGSAGEAVQKRDEEWESEVQSSFQSITVPQYCNPRGNTGTVQRCIASQTEIMTRKYNIELQEPMQVKTHWSSYVSSRLSASSSQCTLFVMLTVVHLQSFHSPPRQLFSATLSFWPLPSLIHWS